MPHAQINGVDLFYDEAGAGEPILFHHGYTGSHDGWEGVVERLRDRFRCIVMDCRGAGDSAQPADGYTIDQYALDVVGMADHLGLERVAYVGHSMGGLIGMWLGLEHARRLTKLVLVAPAPADGIRRDPADRERARALWIGRERDTMIHERTVTAARSVSEEQIVGSIDRALSVSEGHYEESWRSMEQTRIGERLGEIQTPTLMIAAAADDLLPGNLDDFRRLGNATLHVFSRVSHGIPREVPSALSRVLADFMEHGVVIPATLRERLQDAPARGVRG